MLISVKILCVIHNLLPPPLKTPIQLTIAALLCCVICAVPCLLLFYHGIVKAYPVSCSLFNWSLLSERPMSTHDFYLVGASLRFCTLSFITLPCESSSPFLSFIVFLLETCYSVKSRRLCIYFRQACSYVPMPQAHQINACTRPQILGRE
jgi:hypothetical protein